MVWDAAIFNNNNNNVVRRRLKMYEWWEIKQSCRAYTCSKITWERRNPVVPIWSEYHTSTVYSNGDGGDRNSAGGWGEEPPPAKRVGRRRRASAILSATHTGSAAPSPPERPRSSASWSPAQRSQCPRFFLPPLNSIKMYIMTFFLNSNAEL